MSINITGCHRCYPEKWVQVGPSVATYFCLTCRREVNQILEKRRKPNDLHSKSLHSQEQESDAAAL